MSSSTDNPYVAVTLPPLPDGSAGLGVDGGVSGGSSGAAEGSSSGRGGSSGDSSAGGHGGGFGGFGGIGGDAGSEGVGGFGDAGGADSSGSCAGLGPSFGAIPSSDGMDSTLHGCLNLGVVGETYEDSRPDSPRQVAQVVVELAIMHACAEGPYPGRDALKQEVARLWGMPKWQRGSEDYARLELHHLIGQHLVDGVNFAVNPAHYEIYAKIYQSPLLAVFMDKNDHRIGPGSVHSSYGPIAEERGVPLDNGLYPGLATLSPFDYLQVSLGAFRESAPDLYNRWCEVVRSVNFGGKT